jgi:hypothetical protein
VEVATKQLDVLALEPYYGGVRKAVIEAVTRCSRHRWTVLKLPARKLERRLQVAATWFAEQLTRAGARVAKFDVLVASEAMNLADLLRLAPELAHKPSVVYFHDNQLPDAGDARPETALDLVNLNSAMAATEVWFNSVYNLKTFLARASQLVARHEELATRNPVPGLASKSHLMPPPIEFNEQGGQERDRRAVVIDARGLAEPAVVCAAVERLRERGEEFAVTTIGRIKGIECEALAERDDAGHADALTRCGVLVSFRRGASGDELAVRGLAAGCYPVFPDVGVYTELVPREMHANCLHDGTAASVAERILDGWYVERPIGFDIHVGEVLGQYDAVKACRGIDERLARLVGA